MWMNFLKEKPKLHSKQFQYYAILEIANRLHTYKTQPKAIGFGVGNEPIPSALVALGFKVTATDYLDGEIANIWQETGQLVTSSKKLNERGIATDTLFSRNLTFENLDMNRIPESYREKFDFCWSTCALGHIGSYQKGLDFILASASLLKPGGWAVHSTELDLSNKAPLDTPNLSLYREEDLLKRIVDVRGVMIDGKVKMWDSQILAVDGNNITEKFNKLSNRIKKYYECF
jgi:2-polyprenyl-3-methyl-5-hydroxy-6-metoxy-1,4-benzoquinol methylase